MHHISSSKQQVLSKLVKKIPLHSFSAADSKCRVTVGWCFTASSSYVTSFSWPTSHFSYFLFHFNDIGSLCSAPFPSSVFLILFPFNLLSFHTRAFYLVSFYFTSSQLSVCSSPFEPISFFFPWIFYSGIKGKVFIHDGFEPKTSAKLPEFVCALWNHTYIE